MSKLPATKLNWESLGKFQGKVYVHPVPGDGHCLIHSVCFCIFVPYKLGKINNKPVSKSDMVRELRKNISEKLEQKNPKTGNVYYEDLGGLSEIGKEFSEEYSLKSLQKLFLSKKYLGDETIIILEFFLDKCIYVLDKKRKDVYVITSAPERKNSIVILYDGSHFEPVSLRNNNNTYITHFSSDDPFIKHIRKRIRKEKENF